MMMMITTMMMMTMMMIINDVDDQDWTDIGKWGGDAWVACVEVKGQFYPVHRPPPHLPPHLSSPHLLLLVSNIHPFHFYPPHHVTLPTHSNFCFLSLKVSHLSWFVCFWVPRNSHYPWPKDSSIWQGLTQAIIGGLLTGVESTLLNTGDPVQ